MGDTPLRGLKSSVNKEKRKEKEREKAVNKKKLIRDYPMFREIKPKQKYIFHSDYIEVDGSFATILTILHQQGSDDSMGYFWGINLIPRNIGNDVSVRRLEQVERMSESWISTHQGRAEGLLDNEANEVQHGGSMSSRQKLSKKQKQLVEIAQDLMSGSSYLRVGMRLLIKAPTLETLDETIRKIDRQYKDRFDNITTSPHTGEQKGELSNLFNKLDRKVGKKFMFTSAEFAGSYSLVTRGIEDKKGEYIGQMEGDVNNSAVLMDIDKYDSSVVIAGHLAGETLSGGDLRGMKGSDVWGVKLGVCALLRNKRVIHLVLNNAKVDSIGPDLTDITSKVNMAQGDINPFEMFGDKEDELSIFPAHIEKMYLMVEQMMNIPDGLKAIVKGVLDETLNTFYEDKRMWAKNAKENRHALRVVGAQHSEIPRLPVFKAYLDMEHERHKNDVNQEPEVLRAYRFLKTGFASMMNTNGDLFDTITSNIIDNAAISNRVIYNFSSLLKRDRGVMMAQFVNALGYAVGSLTDGDLVVLHGAEQLKPEIKQYVKDKFVQLQDNGVRIVYIYNSVERMIDDRPFNQFEEADYTLLGGMAKPTILKYEDILKQEVPFALKNLLEHKQKYRWYLRRGFDNIVFANDMQMGLN